MTKFTKLTFNELMNIINPMVTQDKRMITKFSGQITSEDTLKPQFLNDDYVNNDNINQICHVGDYISMVIHDKGLTTIKSAVIDKIVICDTSIKIYVDKNFFPIDIEEYVIAPNNKYYDPMVDFYVGKEPLQIDDEK